MRGRGVRDGLWRFGLAVARPSRERCAAVTGRLPPARPPIAMGRCNRARSSSPLQEAAEGDHVLPPSNYWRAELCEAVGECIGRWKENGLA